MAFSAGDVVLVPFPYRDRLAERARPAVVVSADTYNQHGERGKLLQGGEGEPSTEALTVNRGVSEASEAP